MPAHNMFCMRTRPRQRLLTVARDVVFTILAAHLRVPLSCRLRKQYVRQMAIALSHPTWMVQRWLRAFGVDRTVAFCRHNNANPIFGLRILDGTARDDVLAELQRDDVDAGPSDLLPDFIRCAIACPASRVQSPCARLGCTQSDSLHVMCRVTRGLQNVVFGDLMQRGGLAVQDEAAGLVTALLDPQPGECVLDACAAPGGKAIASALRMRAAEGGVGGGALVAADVNPQRLELVRKAANTVGVSDGITTFAADLRQASCAECVLRHRLHAVHVMLRRRHAPHSWRHANHVAVMR